MSDRKTVERAVTSLGFVAALALAVPQPPNVLHVAIGGLVGTALVWVGFAAAWACREPERQSIGRRASRAALSLAAGAVLGGLLVAVLVVLVRAEPALRARFMGRAGEPLWRPLALAFESSILEEVVFRLFVLSVVVCAARLVVRRGTGAFIAGLAVSALLFGLAHLPAWFAVTAPSAGLVAGVLALNGAGGLLFGFVFWRWGLPYAILCHAAGDIVTQTLAPRLLG